MTHLRVKQVVIILVASLLLLVWSAALVAGYVRGGVAVFATTNALFRELLYDNSPQYFHLEPAEWNKLVRDLSRSRFPRHRSRPYRVLILGPGSALGSAIARASLSAGWTVAGADDFKHSFLTAVPPLTALTELRPLSTPAGISVLSALVSRLAATDALDVIFLGFDAPRKDAEAALSQALAALPNPPWVVAVCHSGRRLGAVYGSHDASQPSALGADAPRLSPARLLLVSIGATVAGVVGPAMSPPMAAPVPSWPYTRDSSWPSGELGKLVSPTAALAACTARVGGRLSPERHEFDAGVVLALFASSLLPAVTGENARPSMYCEGFEGDAPMRWGSCEAAWSTAVQAATEGTVVHLDTVASAIVAAASAAVAAFLGEHAAALSSGSSADDGNRSNSSHSVDRLTRCLLDLVGNDASSTKQCHRGYVAVVSAASWLQSLGSGAGWLPEPSGPWLLPPPLLPALLRLPRSREHGHNLTTVASCPGVWAAMQQLATPSNPEFRVGNASVVPASPSSAAWDLARAALLDAAWWALRHASVGGFREPHPSDADFGLKGSGFSAFSDGTRFALADVFFFLELRTAVDTVKPPTVSITTAAC